jgi:MFS superfamily sulfate permease-like transporter
MLSYIMTLLPLPLWILSYNWCHLWEDAVAGLALSLVVIPQSIGFGIMTHISPMHGLYTTFAGLVLY